MDIPKTAHPLDFYRQRVKSQHCGREWSIAIDFTDARILPKTLTLPLSILLSTLTLFSALLLSHCVGYKSILKLAVGLSCRAQDWSSLWIHLRVWSGVWFQPSAQTHLFPHSRVCWHTCCDPGGKFCAFSKSLSSGANQASILFKPCRSKLCQLLHIT